MKLKTIFVQLVKEPEAHARFINTLSLLEYIGARKIMKSHAAESISMRILAHVAEEIRHAQILKGFALQLSQGKLNGYSEEELLCGSVARAYFHTLEEACAHSLSTTDAEKTYALTTLLIEERAMEIYPAYQSVLAEHGIRNALKAIIQDEDKHHSEMQEMLGAQGISEDCISQLRSVEKNLFAGVIAALLHECRAEA